MGILRRLFCTHSFEFVRNLYGDEINDWGYKRSVWRCTKCGKQEGRDRIVSGTSSHASARIDSPSTTSWFFEPRPISHSPDDPAQPRAAEAPFSSGGGGDFSGAGASADWDASSSCAATSYDSGGSSSDSGSCSSSD